jgi:hypothetical protein
MCPLTPEREKIFFCFWVSLNVFFEFGALIFCTSLGAWFEFPTIFSKTKKKNWLKSNKNGYRLGLAGRHVSPTSSGYELRVALNNDGGNNNNNNTSS